MGATTSKRAMRAKTPKAVVTFASTADAMAMEAAAREHGIPGRIIPLPSQISAGCGLAWCVDAAEGDMLVDRIGELGLSHEGLFEVDMY